MQGYKYKREISMSETSTDYFAVRDVARLLQEDKAATLVDARTTEEYKGGLKA